MLGNGIKKDMGMGFKGFLGCFVRSVGLERVYRMLRDRVHSECLSLFPTRRQTQIWAFGLH